MKAKKSPDHGLRKEQTVDEILSDLPAAGEADTVMALMEVYESIERSYRSAVMAGEVQPRVAQSTNY